MSHAWLWSHAVQLSDSAEMSERYTTPSIPMQYPVVYLQLQPGSMQYVGVLAESLLAKDFGLRPGVLPSLGSQLSRRRRRWLPQMRGSICAGAAERNIPGGQLLWCRMEKITTACGNSSFLS